MSELEEILSGDSAAAPAAQILEGLPEELAHRILPGAPHSVYQELWHICFWQQITVDRIKGHPESSPLQPPVAFPSAIETEKETWEELRARFFRSLDQAVAACRDGESLEKRILCPNPSHPDRVMTVREQLESLGAHNTYHLGRIVLLRQLLESWPPPSGGFSW